MTARSHCVPTSVSRSRLRLFGSLENELQVTVVTRRFPRNGLEVWNLYSVTGSELVGSVTDSEAGLGTQCRSWLGDVIFPGPDALGKAVSYRRRPQFLKPDAISGEGVSGFFLYSVGTQPAKAIRTNATRQIGTLYPAYIRGQAYLAAHNGTAAAAEFLKFLDHRGRYQLPTGRTRPSLGLARAYAMTDDTAKARSAYQDFLTFWKDADADIPILKEAKAEYAKLQ